MIDRCTCMIPHPDEQWECSVCGGKIVPDPPPADESEQEFLAGVGIPASKWTPTVLKNLVAAVFLGFAFILSVRAGLQGESWAMASAVWIVNTGYQYAMREWEHTHHD